VLVVGLDGAAPALVFDRFRGDLPALSGLAARGIHGPLESICPPITCPAWACMMTSKDPGQLGIYGFRNRRDRGYGALAFASSHDVREPYVWEVLAALGVPVPRHMIGRALVAGPSGASAYGAEDDAAVRARLEGPGYLG
jgi:predicted AlkP superfamily phosphohydrolase/phosphomutase